MAHKDGVFCDEGFKCKKCKEAWGKPTQIEQLTARVRELEEENARLNSEIEMLKSGKRSNIRLGMELAASQAYAEQLREALETLNKVSDIGCDRVEKALALPRDTSAIDAYVAEAMKCTHKQGI